MAALVVLPAQRVHICIPRLHKCTNARRWYVLASLQMVGENIGKPLMERRLPTKRIYVARLVASLESSTSQLAQQALRPIAFIPFGGKRLCQKSFPMFPPTLCMIDVTDQKWGP
jgi:hypothetical protein